MDRAIHAKVVWDPSQMILASRSFVTTKFQQANANRPKGHWGGDMCDSPVKGSIKAAPYTAGTGSEMMLELLKVPLMAPSGYGMV